MKSILCASATLAACAVLGAVSQNFDGMTSGAALPAEGTNGWKGDGTVTAVTEGNNVLSVDGTVTCDNTANAAAACASCTFKVAFPDEGSASSELSVLAGDELAECQIAIAAGEAVGDDLKVMVYNGTSWSETGCQVAKSTEVVVSLDFDYVANMCKIKVGDEYATRGVATTAPGETAQGPWFALASSAVEAKKSSITKLYFVGSTTVDNVGIEEVTKATLPGALAGLTNVDQAKINEWGVTPEKLTSPNKVGTSGLTVAEKLECGLDPTDDTKFVAKAITSAADNKIALTLPCVSDNGQDYEVVVMDENDASEDTAQIFKVGNKNVDFATQGEATLTVAPTKTGKVLKFKVRAKAPTTSPNASAE